MSNNILCVLIARGGSKGIKDKNIQTIGGIPMICHSQRKILEAQKIIDLDYILSTDCPRIREIAETYGPWAPFLRPSELAGDLVPSFPVVEHAIQQAEIINSKRYDIVVYIQPTCPLFRVEDLLHAINSLISDPSLDSAVAITPVETHPFKMKRLLSNGRIINYIDQGMDEMRPRQLLPPVYRRAGSIYASRRRVIDETSSLIGKECKGIVVPTETAIDIDSKSQLELVRSIFNKDQDP